MSSILDDRVGQCVIRPARRGMNMAEHIQETLVDVEGLVKWFDPKKGFGFIVGPEGQDIFAHYSKIEGDGFRVLKDGAKVIYSAERGDKGWHASRIARVADEAVERRTYTRSPRR